MDHSSASWFTLEAGLIQSFSVACAGEALELLLERETREGLEDAMYIKTWDYVRGGSGVLQNDFLVPEYFDRSSSILCVWSNGHADQDQCSQSSQCLGTALEI